MNGDTISKIIPVIVLLIIGLIEAIGGLYLNDRRTKNDFKIEVLSLVILPTLIQPSIFLLIFLVADSFFPSYENYFSEISIWWHVLAFLILDDMLQYWWHRLSHVSKIMWKLHRPHHVVEEMGVLVTYRNAILYYALMPGIWFSGVLIYLGMGYVYLIYLPIKLVVILLAHSETKWDQYLYRYKVLHPLAWVIERTISTPSTHFAHHGLTDEDEISNPNGNFGNLLFLWDIIFGTAKITRKYPKEFGVENLSEVSVLTQLFWPIFRSPQETKIEEA